MKIEAQDLSLKEFRWKLREVRLKLLELKIKREKTKCQMPMKHLFILLAIVALAAGCVSTPQTVGDPIVTRAEERIIACRNCGTEMGAIPAGRVAPDSTQTFRCPNRYCGCDWQWTSPAAGGKVQWISVGRNLPTVAIICPRCQIEMARARVSELRWVQFECPLCGWWWKYNPATRSKTSNYPRWTGYPVKR